MLKLKDRRYDTLKSKLSKSKSEVEAEKTKWQDKLDKLNAELETASDNVYLEKRKRRNAVSQQLQKTQQKETELRNYIEGLEEKNAQLAEDCLNAIKDKAAAKKASDRVKRKAAARLKNWHAERNARRAAEDELARQADVLTETEKVLESYRDAAQNSADTKRRMKKEWLEETAKAKKGGRQRWPVWVVQLICELLVNGTPPTAIPGNIRIMYETLYGEPPEDEPSVNFVRECRPVVEVIGETIAAIKLADAGSWDQLWTDATTRRQIPFTALIIGVLGNSEKIDPIVVSSCIFLEDETSETQADGIVNKVSVLCVSCHLNHMPTD